MKGYRAFWKKELRESLKTFRFPLLLAVFLLFGLSSPFLAWYTPELAAVFAPELTLDAAPQALDAWAQFFKNLSGVGFSVFLILFSNSLSREYSRGTLVLLVTKGLRRPSVLAAKYTAAAVLMSLSYWLSFAAARTAAAALWPGERLPHLALSAGLLWLMGLLYLSILLLGCVLFRQAFGSVLFTAGVVVLLTLLGLVPALGAVSPMRLTSQNLDLIAGAAAPLDFLLPLLTAAVLGALAFGLAVRLFQKKLL